MLHITWVGQTVANRSHPNVSEKFGVCDHATWSCVPGKRFESPYIRSKTSRQGDDILVLVREIVLSRNNTWALRFTASGSMGGWAK